MRQVESVLSGRVDSLDLKDLFLVFVVLVLYDEGLLPSASKHINEVSINRSD